MSRAEMEPDEGPLVAGPDDVDDVVDILVEAFYEDPLWSWAFPDRAAQRDQHRQLWGLSVEGAVRYPCVWLAGNRAATSVWIPPGGTEFSEEPERRLEPLVQDLLGADSDRVMETFDLFERTHPRTEPHFYLSLLGTDPLQAGHGHGLRLLADNLRRIDETGAPSYLEASNAANVPLYRRYGFEVLDSFQPPGGPQVFTMWRQPGGSA